MRELLGQATSSELEVYNLGPLHSLEPELESFLEAPTPMQGAGNRGDSQLECSIKNYEVWLEWQAHQVNMPAWWGELVAIPNAGDPKRLVCMICTSFEILWERSKALRGSNSYTTPLPQNASEGRCSCWSQPPSTLSGLPSAATSEDPGLCPSPSVLG